MDPARLLSVQGASDAKGNEKFKLQFFLLLLTAFCLFRSHNFERRKAFGTASSEGIGASN